MVPEITLLAVSLFALLLLKWRHREFRFAQAARIGMAAMLFVTGGAHFGFAKGMAMMLPEAVPFKMGVVYLTGILEIAAGIGLLIPKMAARTGWWLIAFFVCITPANIYAALHHVNLETAGYDGNGPAYLWFRLPLQLIFIAWVYYSAIRPATVPRVAGHLV